MEIQKHLADRTGRLLAYLIDIVPIIAAVGLIFYFFFGFDEVLSAYLVRGEAVEPREAFLAQRSDIRDISFLIWVLYCIIMESSPRQGTFGKSAMGIKVVDSQGNRLSLAKSALRNISKILSLVIVFLGFVWILFDKKRQGWHDKIQNTFVVDKAFQIEGRE
ncbi:RDD family protein [Algoriphagus namhaensis]